MISVKNYLLFIGLIFFTNVSFAQSIPDEIAAVCGERPCEVVFKKIKKFAKNGSSHAQAVLALLYRGGYGTEVDEKLSLKYMKRAALSRLPFAQYDLGMLYKLGHSVEKDEAESDLWLQRAAKAGYKPAIEMLTSENKLSENAQKSIWPTVDDGTERITVTPDQYTLTDLVDYLASLGYGRKNNTGSRIRGKGCGSDGTSCVKVQINSPVGMVHFNNIVSTINTGETGRAMAAMIK